MTETKEKPISHSQVEGATMVRETKGRVTLWHGAVRCTCGTKLHAYGRSKGHADRVLRAVWTAHR